MESLESRALQLPMVPLETPEILVPLETAEPRVSREPPTLFRVTRALPEPLEPPEMLEPREPLE